MNGTPMKTNKLPKSAWSDSEAAGSQSQYTDQLSKYQMHQNQAIHARHVDCASNDASYHHASCNDAHQDSLSQNISSPIASQSNFFGYKSKSAKNNNVSAMSPDVMHSNPFKASAVEIDSLKTSIFEEFEQSTAQSNPTISPKNEASVAEIPERIFMNGLIKHTGIALAIIIPLAAFSAYAATPPMTQAVATTKTSTELLDVKPSNIIHKSASSPTTVDSVDLKKYAGTWYEIGRLPMYFQRNCASDVTANYVEKTDGSGIKVINQCKAEDGSGITAEGLAKPADATGSKLKVTFLPSWIRWLPVGRADYWVLARDAEYKTALVGTPDKKYLWLLARSPNVSQDTYAKYRQIAQQQGYDLKEFKLTAQTNQTVNLIP